MLYDKNESIFQHSQKKILKVRDKCFPMMLFLGIGKYF